MIDAPLGIQLMAPIENCPPNSAENNNRCNCLAGYRQSTDARSCGRKYSKSKGVSCASLVLCSVRQVAQLVEYAGTAPISIPDGFTSSDCAALFTGPVEAVANLRCQCVTGTRLNADSNGCCEYREEVDAIERQLST